jgi:hypothetical protein
MRWAEVDNVLNIDIFENWISLSIRMIPNSVEYNAKTDNDVTGLDKGCNKSLKIPKGIIRIRKSKKNRQHNGHLSHQLICNRYQDSLIYTGATSRAGTACHSGLPEFTPGFTGVRVSRSLVLCVCFLDRCLSFCPFSLIRES